MLILSLIGVLLAALPLFLFLRNLKLYVPPPLAQSVPSDMHLRSVSVLIPARNEEHNIQGAIQAVLDNKHPVEVIVLDDNSFDLTVRKAMEMRERDPNVRVELAPGVPPGWTGKQFTCATLAKLAQHPHMLFVDADVRLAPDAIVRMLAFQEQSGADLVSGFPRQVTVTFYEQLAVPLLHFLTLGFLSIERMRKSPTKPAYGTGCGQLFLTTTAAYQQMGGHEAIKSSLHDGLKLPKAYRKAGLKTDLCDATDVAMCRPYTGGEEVWNGLARTATEGLATPLMILPWTIILIGGQVLPVSIFLLNMVLLTRGDGLAMMVSALGTLMSYLPRFLGVGRFQQSISGALLHPVGIVYIVMIQWYALFGKIMGKQVSWRGREYQAG